MLDLERLGFHTISVYLLLHNAIFIASILFNAQSWSNMSDKNIDQIAVIQRKFLKQILKVPQSTANSVVYLELGIMPLKFEVHKRQLTFLHHVVNLVEDDPVRKMWKITRLQDYKVFFLTHNPSTIKIQK